jgi:hypothetical protein
VLSSFIQKGTCLKIIRYTISHIIKKLSELFQTDNFSISEILFDFIISSKVIIQLHKYHSTFILSFFNSVKKFQDKSSKFLLLKDILSKVLAEIHFILE